MALVATFPFLTMAIKNNPRAAKPMIANVNSIKDDSISGIKRSRFDTMVLIANKANAIETNNIRLIPVFL